MRLRNTMTFAEMSRHMQRFTEKHPTVVSVTEHATALGYTPYKPIIKGKQLFFFIRENKIMSAKLAKLISDYQKKQNESKTK